MNTSYYIRQTPEAYTHAGAELDTLSYQILENTMH